VTSGREIRILSVPVELHGLAAAHSAALQREFELIARDDPGAVAEHGVLGLRSLMEGYRNRFGVIGDQPDAAVASARERGDTEVDLCFDAPQEVGEACRELLDILAAADDYCRSGDLITMATPPDVLAYRQWFLSEFILQLEGREPLPWVAGPVPAAPEVHVSSGEALTEGADLAGWNISGRGPNVRIGFTGDLDLVSAPHLRTLVADAARAEGLSELELDLSGVTFIDSVGLSVLLAVRMRLGEEAIRVTVLTSPSVERVFTLAGVRNLFLA
jgi:anti-sigma B factor antagonist